MKLREIVARNVKQLRMERRWTQKALAKKARITDKYISLIESNARNISLDQLEKIAKALDVSITALILEDKGPKAKRTEMGGHFDKIAKDTERLEGSLQTLKSDLEACRIAMLEKI